MEIENQNYITPGKPILSEKVICPNCTRSVKIILNNNLFKSNGIDIQPKVFSLPEFDNIKCNHCQYIFTFIYCVFCNEKIMMKINQTSEKYNGLNGFNIRCPFKSCNKIFYISECPECSSLNKTKNFIGENNIITCTKEDCHFQYLLVNCPYKFCPDIIRTPRAKCLSGCPMGVIITHQRKILYQKITCLGCRRPICFGTRKEKQNKYHEGQRVVCPYPDCQKVFNRLICSFCSKENYIDKGWYEYGSSIQCTVCKENFGKILCTSCGELSICKEKFFKFGEYICGMENCRKVNNLMNCLYCRQINIMENKIPLYGRRIKCGYCFKSFCKITCPHCSGLNRFPYANFFFGKLYKCQYFNCNKEFQILICSKCYEYNAIAIKKEGHKYQCEKCKTIYMNIGCKFCKLNILFENCNELKSGNLIKCPNITCNKIFSFMECYKCEKLIYSEENESIYGTVKQCSNPNCLENTIMTLCPFCNKRVLCKGRNSLEENQSTRCKNCKRIYTFHRQRIGYQGEAKILGELEGKPFEFGKGEIDENFLAKQDLFFTKNDISETKGEEYIFNQSLNFRNFGACIICHNNKKESVFYPCGHRCSCYECAISVFTSEKKCPKCKEEIICVIRKVYE